MALHHALKWSIRYAYPETVLSRFGQHMQNAMQLQVAGRPKKDHLCTRFHHWTAEDPNPRSVSMGCSEIGSVSQCVRPQLATKVLEVSHGG